MTTCKAGDVIGRAMAAATQGTLAACATAPKNMPPKYVSPPAYRDLDCEALDLELVFNATRTDEYRQLKGEFIALRAVAKLRGCGLTPTSPDEVIRRAEEGSTSGKSPPASGGAAD